MIAAILISFPLGDLSDGFIVAAGSTASRCGFRCSVLSLPNFWLGPLLMILFSLQLGWLPVSGRGTWSHLVLPALTLGLGMAAILTRMLRASLLQVMRRRFRPHRARQRARAKNVSG